MDCPYCAHDNIAGVDLCEACGQPLTDFDESGTELEQAIARHQVDVLCPKMPLTVDATASVREAIGQLVDRKIGCLLVQQDDRLVGIFTERDVLNKVSSDLSCLDRPVSEFMTSHPGTITRQDSIAYALHAMDLGGYRHQPVVDESGQPTGIISIRDILRYLCIRFGELRAQSG